MTLNFLEAVQLFLDGKKVRSEDGWVYWCEGGDFYAAIPGIDDVIKHDDLSDYLREVLAMYDVLDDWEIINDD